MDNGRRVETRQSPDTGTAPSREGPAGFVYCTAGNATLLIRREYERSAPLAELLTTGDVPAGIGRSVISGGRGSASVHALAGIGDVVLRRYRRGGLVGKVLVDRYLFASRPFRELSVLARAGALGVPVPEAVGASSMRTGALWHRGRIVTRLIERSVTLPVFIEAKRDDARLAAALEGAGKAVRRMHDAGIDHADLNMNNVLVDESGAAWIIDFDKARLHERLGRTRRIRNLRRLLRSLRKLAAAGRRLEEGDFSMIIGGYAGNDRGLLAEIEKKTLGSRLLALRSAVRRPVP